MTHKLVSTIMIPCALALMAKTANAVLEGPIVGASATLYVTDFPEHGYTATAEWDEDALHWWHSAPLNGTGWRITGGGRRGGHRSRDALDNGASVYARDASGETVMHHVTDTAGPTDGARLPMPES